MQNVHSINREGWETREYFGKDRLGQVLNVEPYACNFEVATVWHWVRGGGGLWGQEIVMSANLFHSWKTYKRQLLKL